MPQKGYLFDPVYNYTKFRNYVSEKSNKRTIKVLVECDISNFYDRLNLHRLESSLKAIPNINRDYIDILNELLLYWSNRDSYGLPVGSNASRILVEASLIEVDNYLISQKIDFCRFVDDYRLFAKDTATAHHWLSLLVEKLNKEGLFLNTNKTKIKDVSHLNNKNFNKENTEKQKSSITKEIKLKNDFKEDKIFPKIIRGYSGLIPTKFKEMTTSEKEILKLKNERELLKEIKNSIIIEPKEIINIIKVIVAQEKYELFEDFPFILEKFPQFLPYFVSVLIKHQDVIKSSTCLAIKENFYPWFEKENLPEYILIYLIRLFKEIKFQDKDTLFKYFRNLKRNAGHYIGRALLEALENTLTRGELLEIRDYYTRADLLEKRQILKMVGKILSEGEKRPFFKDVAIHSSDLMSSFIIKTKAAYINIIKK